MSKSASPFGKNPSAAPPRTCGSLGSNNDAADPKTPSWFLGDTPGSLGRNDQGDPKINRCLQRFCFDYKLLTARKKVNEEIKEVLKIRDAFVDKKLLNEALEKDWSTEEYPKESSRKGVWKSTAERKTSHAREPHAH